DCAADREARARRELAQAREAPNELVTQHVERPPAGPAASRRRRTQAFRGQATTLRKTPMPSIDTSTTSPAASGPTPAGVPVRITSPGFSVITEEMKAMIRAQSNTIIDVRPLCFTTPFTRVVSARSFGLIDVSIHGPSGQKVSKLLARVNCTSFF